MNQVSACLEPIAALNTSAASTAHRVALVPNTTSLSATPTRIRITRSEIHRHAGEVDYAIVATSRLQRVVVKSARPGVVVGVCVLVRGFSRGRLRSGGGLVGRFRSRRGDFGVGCCQYGTGQGVRTHDGLIRVCKGSSDGGACGWRSCQERGQKLCTGDNYMWLGTHARLEYRAGAHAAHQLPIP